MTQFLLQRLLAFVSLAILGVGAYLCLDWWDRWADVRGVAGPQAAEALSRIPLYVGLGLLAWSVFGGLIVPLLFARPGGDGRRLHHGGEPLVVKGADGSDLYIETHGPKDAPALIFTHGWGMDSTVWWEAKRDLAERYRLIVWDLPGLGRSSPPADGHYRIERLAQDLREVVKAAGQARVILVGHSIGGMTVQTFGRLYPDLLGRQVAGLVLANTTHVNPLRTMIFGRMFQVLQKPVIEPMMWLDMWLNPLVWLLNWQSYLSGSTQLAFRLAGFGARPTRAQLNQAALLATRNSPKIQAKGNMAMFRWEVTGDLPRLRLPTLVFTGGRDVVTLPQAGEAIVRAIPDGREHRLAKAGHLGPMECAEDYNAAIEAFADAVFTAGARSADGASRPRGPSAPRDAESRAFDRRDGPQPDA